MSSIKLYFFIISLKLRSQLEYPLNAIIGFINQFAVLFFEFIAMWGLFDRFGKIKGWTFNEVFITYGIINLSFAVSETLMRGFETKLTSLIRNGDYDRYLLRPRNTIIQVSAFSFEFVRIGRVIQSVIVLGIGIVINAKAINGFEWVVLMYTIFGGWLLYFTLYIFTGIIAFKVLQYTEFMSIFIQGSVSTMVYPITIFPIWIRRLFTYVLPAAAISYYPIAAILGKDITVNTAVAYLTPLICYILFIISVFTFFFVEKAYISSGS